MCSAFLQTQQPNFYRDLENIHPYCAPDDWSVDVVTRPDPHFTVETIENCDTEHAGAGKDAMEVDSALSNSERFARFPPRSQRSPTYWHKTTAVGVAGMELPSGQIALPLDDSRVRTWECSYGGCSDIY